MPMFVFFTIPPYSGSEGRMWYPSRIEWSIPTDVQRDCLVKLLPEINSARLSSFTSTGNVNWTHCSFSACSTTAAFPHTMRSAIVLGSPDTVRS
eukprot:2581926-Pyramimonas_sp.AAC.1